MASAERFALFPCSLTHAGGDLDLAQMQNFSITPGSTVDRIFAAGAVDPKAHILAYADPQITFGTQDLVTYFAAVSATAGLKTTVGTFRLQERSDYDGVWESSTTHVTWTTAAGHLIPTRLSCSQDSNTGCVLESRLVVLYDGSTVPLVHNTGVDFSTAPTPAFTSEFFLGPVYINSSEIKGITNVDIDFGINVSAVRTSGSVWAKSSAIIQRAPMITFTTLKADVTASVNMFLRALAGTTAIYLWKGSDAGSRVAVGTTSHFKLSFSAGVWKDDTVSVSDNNDGTVSVSLMNTGTISVATNSAIP